MGAVKSENVIFVCSFNSVRSPIAEGLLRRKTNGHSYAVCSAGIAPVRVRPYAVKVMREKDIDISGHIPASLYQFRQMKFDYVVSLCNNARPAAEEVLSGGDQFFHRDFTSPPEIGKPAEEIMGEYRKLRDEIEAWLDMIFPVPSGPPNASDRTGTLAHGSHPPQENH